MPVFEVILVRMRENTGLNTDSFYAVENFEAVIENLSGEVDLLMISETKIYDRFPKSQCLIKGLNYPFHIDRNIHGGGSYCMSEKTYLLNFYQ